MVRRSLAASQEGIEIAKKALISKKLKQQDLVGKVTIPKNLQFGGKPTVKLGRMNLDKL